MEFSGVIKYNMDPHSAMKYSGKQNVRKQHNFWYASPSKAANMKKTEDEVGESCHSLMKVYLGLFLNDLDTEPKGT